MVVRFLLALSWGLVTINSLPTPSDSEKPSKPLDSAVDDDFLLNFPHLDKHPLRKSALETGKRVANWTEESGVNPEELGDYIEGDMINTKSLGRSGLKSNRYRWPGGVVPYRIGNEFSAVNKKLIMQAIGEFHKHTCIRFVPQTQQKDYVYIMGTDSGCYSEVGHLTGVQTVNLQIPACVTLLGTVIHELMHTIGFIHEHNRDDRDDYVHIMWPNIRSDYKNNFDKYERGFTYDFKVKYDYDSVMHYSANTFSVNGQSTIVPKSKQVNVKRLGQRKRFSPSDLKKINRMYRCDLPPAEREKRLQSEKRAIFLYQCVNDVDCLTSQVGNELNLQDKGNSEVSD